MAWEEVRLGDIIHVKHGWAFKGEYFSDNGNLIVVTPGNFIEKGGFKYTIGKEKFYTDSFPKEYLLKKNDLIIAMTEQADGLLGSPALVPENNKFLHNQRIGLITKLDNSKVDEKFIYFLFFDKKLRIDISNSSTGTKVRHTSPKSIYKLKINLPSLETQQKIVNLISNYDDLIENNNKRIKLLESMAEELYKEWFVRLRFPNYQNTKIEDGIPQGWEEKTINKLCEVTSSKRIFSSEYIEKGIPFFRGKEITLKSNNKSIDDILYIKQEKYEEIKKSFGVPKEKDILLTAVGTIGSIYSVKKSDDEFYFKDGNLIWLKNFNNEVEYFIYYFLKSEEIQNKLENISIGSSQKALTIDSIKKITVIVPTNDIIILFNKLIEPILKEIDILQQKTQTLKETRDLLLPRLLSRKLDIEKLDIN